MNRIEDVLTSVNLGRYVSPYPNTSPVEVEQNKSPEAPEAVAVNEKEGYEKWLKLHQVLKGHSVSGLCDAISCGKNVCDTICGSVCDVICDKICDGICDTICDKICDGVCDKVCDSNLCDAIQCDRDGYCDAI